MSRSDPSIVRLSTLDEADVHQLADLLIDCVAGGASIGFMASLDRQQAMAFWRTVDDGIADGRRLLLVARDSGGICGTVQLALATPPNQPHRADLCKVLVHRRARRRGLGSALMQAAEDAARDLGRWLLVLDTVTDSEASRLYLSLGWVRVGDIPGYALMPDGQLCSTTYFYKDLRLQPRSKTLTPWA